MLEERIKVARGLKKCHLVLKNARLVNVYSSEVIATDIAIHHDSVIAIGTDYQGEEEVDLKNMYIAPGFIDGHLHI